MDGTKAVMRYKLLPQACAVWSIVIRLAAPASAAPVESVLYDFSGAADGGFPQAALAMDGKGALYGTTTSGGSAGLGTVFKLTPLAAGSTHWIFSVLHDFKGGADGSVPYAGVSIAATGQVYGVTYEGGPANAGTVFELLPPAGTGTKWNERILYSFTGGADGGSPTGRLALGKAGVLYGTATAGGVSGVSGTAAGNGVVFSLMPPAKGSTAWTQHVLYSFVGSGSTPGDGEAPAAGVIIDKQGALYGTTEIGGVPGVSDICTYRGGCGIAYKLTPPAAGASAWTEHVLWRFSAVSGDGAIPFGELTFGPGGVLYGLTADGGSYPPSYGNLNLGTAFQLTPPAAGRTAWTETVIHDFGFFGDFAYPVGNLIIDSSGALYGAALDAGSLTPVGASGGGGVFKLSPPVSGSVTWTETHLHNFTDSFGDFCLTGCYPESGVVADSSGAIYGTTLEGGTFPQTRDNNVSPGVVFKITQ
jgi:uncharacterized repeat protein (TIGR03803 family)